MIGYPAGSSQAADTSNHERLYRVSNTRCITVPRSSWQRSVEHVSKQAAFANSQQLALYSMQ
jgi:hypothetical protein